MNAEEISNSSISEAQLRANRANAQKSTGPRTEEGKARARFNARRHGLTGQFYCMSDEDEKAYKDFEIDILKTSSPSEPTKNNSPSPSRRTSGVSTVPAP